MSSLVLIDTDYQNESDEIAITNSKIEILKNNADFIYFLFKTSIEYGMMNEIFIDLNLFLISISQNRKLS